MLKVSRSIKENAWKVNRAAEKWQNTYGRDATLEELSQETGIAVEDIVLSMSASTEVDSLYRPVPGAEGKEITLQEQIKDEKNELEREVNHIFLEQLLDTLDGRERQLIYLRYFRECTQSDVAKIFGTTQVQVSRMEKKLLAKMRSLA